MPAAQRTVVARLLPVGKAAALADVAHDARARRQADAELLSNSSVHIARRARAAFASGSVDLRAATLLALMAQVGDVKVVSVGRVAAESAAGLPVRRISLALPDRSALPQTLAMLPATYRPTSVLASAVVCRLTWPVQMPPFRSVQ
jgi:hypothetical protein